MISTSAIFLILVFNTGQKKFMFSTNTSPGCHITAYRLNNDKFLRSKIKGEFKCVKEVKEYEI